MGGTHVVIGGTGALGSAIVHELAARGLPVRAFVRDEAKARDRLPEGVDLLVGDARDVEAVVDACDDAAAVYNCVLLPFGEWADVFPVVTSNVVAGARRSSATVVQPSVAFGYGPFRESPASEDHPRNPVGPLGRVRNEMERTVLDAHEAGEIGGVVAMLGGFYGPRTDNEITGPVFEAALEGDKAPWLGKRDVPIDYVFIEDAARACVLLATNEDTHGEVWHVPGEPITAERFTRLAGEVAGTDPGLRMASGPMLRLLGLFNADLRAVREVRWLFEEPSLLDDGKFRERFPEFAYTPHEEGIPRTVEWFRERDARDA